MPGLLPDVDPDGLLEYSVVYTDRSLNHMSQRFQRVMRDIAATLEEVYHGDASAIVPGSGTFGMEAVARQLATGQRCLVIRNGWFSYRWSQIIDAGAIAAATRVEMAKRVGTGPRAPFAPPPIDAVVRAIHDERPGVVFAPHVETASGMILPDAYLRAVGDAVHEVGGLFVLDCIASGSMWVDMAANRVDVLLSAPQKGWSSPAGCALVVLSQRARKAVEGSTSTSFSCDLKRWLGIMDTYKSGAHAYHGTMPTDSLLRLRDTMDETRRFGFDRARAAQVELGDKVRALLAAHDMPSVAAPGFGAPGVVVSYTTDPEIQSGKRFAALGVQIAAGVPLQVNEGSDFRTFRLGLFGLDKLRNVDRSVRVLEQALAGGPVTLDAPRIRVAG